MRKNRLLYPSFLILLSLWLGWTILVDFFVIPAVFKTIHMFFLAGDLGIVVFSNLNNLEIVTASLLVSLLSFQVSKNRKALPLLIGAIILWSIAMLYFTYLTPKILQLTELWKKTDLMGIIGVAGIPDIQQEHHFFHKLYITIDTAKIFIILAMLTLGIIKEEKWT